MVCSDAQVSGVDVAPRCIAAVQAFSLLGSLHVFTALFTFLQVPQHQTFDILTPTQTRSVYIARHYVWPTSTRTAGQAKHDINATANDATTTHGPRPFSNACT
jgi:hypothetical protein